MKIHEFFDNPSKWTQNVYARDALGNEVDADDPDAVSWNLSGAINYCYFLTTPAKIKDDIYKLELAMKMHQIIDIIGTPQVWDWEANPKRTFEEIKAIVVQVDI
jgi:hypothetical protein